LKETSTRRRSRRRRNRRRKMKRKISRRNLFIVPGRSLSSIHSKLGWRRNAALQSDEVNWNWTV
jgi:hypothetical protein